MYKQYPRILHSVPKQDPRILPSVPKQDSPSANSLSDEGCDSDWSPFENHCYLVGPTAKTWQDAQDYCASWGANLVKIESDGETDFVVHKLGLIGRKKAWIGMKAALDWYDHSNPDYQNWGSGEPDGQATNPCVWMYGNDKPYSGLWNADTCDSDSDIGVVCEKQA